MYWYIKYPLYLLAAIAAGGCLFLLYKNVPGFSSGISAPTAAVAPASGRTESPVVTEQLPVPPPPHALRPSVPAPTGEDPAVAAPPSPQPGAAAAEGPEPKLRAAEEQLHADNLLAARTLALSVLDNPASPAFTPLWIKAAEIVSIVNATLISSDAPAPEKVRYVVQPGDTLIGIANKHKTTVTAIERGNKMNAGTGIYPGMVLLIYTANWSILVSKTKFGLILYDGTKVFKYYHVGIGRQNRTPVGVFRVGSKLREPSWSPPGKTIPYGDPRNVLGTRWLGIQPIEKTDPALKGFGIHGTWEPNTIGTAVSEGCVRLKNDDINDLFDLTPIGTRVTIKDD